ncbi:MAG: sulfatase, partial [Phycisphaerae bacterium]
LLLISVDTLRADRLSCYGYGKGTSPNIDGLAADAHRFTRAYTPMPNTLPSHTSMMTGLYPGQVGVLMNGHTVPGEAHTLAERLKERGFKTGACVGAFILNKKFGLDQGFDTYESPWRGEWKCAQVAKRAGEWLERNRSRRFFYFAHMYDPHVYYEAPAEFRSRFDVNMRKFPETIEQIEFLRRDFDYTPEQLAEACRAYDSEIAYADHYIGVLLKKLRELELFDRTIIVFTSDHGETLDELYERYHFAFDHSEFLYRRELNVPLIIRLPAGFAQAGPAVHDQSVTQLDLLPTVLELLGVPCDRPFEGRSMVSILRGEPWVEAPVISERRSLSRLRANKLLRGGELSVIDGDWHLIASPGRGDELFNMRDDPTEIRNIKDQHSDRVRQMKSILREWAETARPLWGISEAPTNKEVIRRLKELGYLVGEEE